MKAIFRNDWDYILATELQFYRQPCNSIALILHRLLFFMFLFLIYRLEIS